MRVAAAVLAVLCVVGGLEAASAEPPPITTQGQQ